MYAPALLATINPLLVQTFLATQKPSFCVLLLIKQEKPKYLQKRSILKGNIPKDYRCNKLLKVRRLKGERESRETALRVFIPLSSTALF
jgi:hypothetical protein